MTLMEMLQQGMVFHLIGMGILFILIGIMINQVGNKPVPKDQSASHQTEHKTGANPAVIAAITAAVKEYRKK